MDEPTANLDVEFREKFYGYMRSITSEGTKGIVFASHLVDELEQIADYLLWIGAKEDDNQKIIAVQQYFGSIEDLTKNYQLVEATIEDASEINKTAIVGTRLRDNHQEMLVQIERSNLPERLKAVSRYATLKEIMYYIEKGKANETDSTKHLDRK
jgi:ABC-2 type transport system ATP-binding protein